MFFGGTDSIIVVDLYRTNPDLRIVACKNRTVKYQRLQPSVRPIRSTYPGSIITTTTTLLPSMRPMATTSIFRIVLVLSCWTIRTTAFFSRRRVGVSNPLGTSTTRRDTLRLGETVAAPTRLPKVQDNHNNKAATPLWWVSLRGGSLSGIAVTLLRTAVKNPVLLLRTYDTMMNA